MRKPDIACIRREHAEAEGEHREWLSAIDRWRGQYESALDLLKEVLAEMVEQQIDLCAHEMAIKSHGLRLRHHETALACRAGEEAGSNGDELSSAHERLMAVHAERRQFHEILAKRKHDSIWRLVEARRSLAGKGAPRAVNSRDLAEIGPVSRLDEAFRRRITAM
jgi:hypothetical protein